MSENPFFLLEHLGNTIYKEQKQNPSINYLNSFCLLNKTITSVFTPREGNHKIYLKELKNLDKINNEKVKLKFDDCSSPYNLKKQNFVENTQYENILSAKKNFENIHKDEHDKFNLLKNEDKSNSSFYYHIQIISNLKNSGELKKIEMKMKKRLENLKDYEKENYSLISSSFMCNGAPQELKYYRRIKSNGNSFYMSFMYQYIKNLIYKREEKIVSEMFYIIDKELNPKYMNRINNNDNNENPPQNKGCIIGEIYISKSLGNDSTSLFQNFAFLSLLYNSMTEDSIDEALKILNYAATYEESFANYMCLYMKLQIKNFINKNRKIFTYEKYCKQYNLIEERYYKNKEFLYEDYIINNIFTNQLEPSLFIISLIPYVFNVSMNLYINEKNNSFKKIYFDLKDDYEADITISILYSSFSYHILEENKDNINPNITIDNSNTLNLENNYKNFNIEKYSKINVGIKNCNICNKSEFIILKNISEFEICLNCLKQTIDGVLINRYNKMLSERFKYLEFYLRDIPLLASDNESTNYIFLSPPEFYCIFQCNMFFYFRNLIKGICDHCGKLQNNLIMKPCGCKNCINDIESKIKEIPITDFEKNYIYKDKKVKCDCGIENSYVELALKLYNEIDYNKKNLLKTSIDNSKYLKNYCMICGIDLKIESIGKERKEFNQITFKTCNEHKVCKECYQKKDKNIYKEMCIICGKIHDNNDEDKIPKVIEKEKTESSNMNSNNNANNESAKNTLNDKNNENNKNTQIRRNREKMHCCIIY